MSSRTRELSTGSTTWCTPRCSPQTGMRCSSPSATAPPSSGARPRANSAHLGGPRQCGALRGSLRRALRVSFSGSSRALSTSSLRRAVITSLSLRRPTSSLRSLSKALALRRAPGGIRCAPLRRAPHDLSRRPFDQATLGLLARSLADLSGLRGASLCRALGGPRSALSCGSLCALLASTC